MPTRYAMSAFRPFNKHEVKDKATATMVVVVLALEVVIVAKVKVKDNGICESKSKRTTLKRLTFLPPYIAPIAEPNITC